MDYLKKPSILAHTLNGALFILAFILVFIYYSSLNKLSSIILILLFSIAVGIHGLSHLGLEYVYGYSPYKSLEGFQGRYDCPCPMMRAEGCQLRASST
jgi:hypothetical protein